MIENRGGELERDCGERSETISPPTGAKSPSSDELILQDPGEPRCGECGGLISQSDVVCPHCGTSLVAG